MTEEELAPIWPMFEEEKFPQGHPTVSDDDNTWKAERSVAMEGTLMTISEEIDQENTPKKALPPVIFETVEYERRRVQRNPGVDRIPHDVLRINPTEMERPLREILYAGDNRSQKPAFGGKKWEIAQVRGLGGDEISAFIAPNGLGGNRAAF